jgi:hypothetical protein
MAMTVSSFRAKLYLGLCLCSLFLSSLACGVPGDPVIQEAWTTADEAGKIPTNVFGPEDVIYVQFKLSNSLFGDQLQAVWTTVAVPGNKPGTVISEHEMESAGPSGYFGLSNDDPWPAGEYRVEVYINGVLGASVDFSVEISPDG